MSKHRRALRNHGTAIQPHWTPLEPATPKPGEERKPGATLLGATELYINSRYQVAVRREETGAMHLSIHRLDKQPIHDWRDLQRIKNEIAGPEAEAIELYPAESRLVDIANETHLWVFVPGFVLPIGWRERLVSEAESHGSRQRPFEDKPTDLMSAEELLRRIAALEEGSKG